VRAQSSAKDDEISRLLQQLQETETSFAQAKLCHELSTNTQQQAAQRAAAACADDYGRLQCELVRRETLRKAACDSARMVQWAVGQLMSEFISLQSEGFASEAGASSGMMHRQANENVAPVDVQALGLRAGDGGPAPAPAPAPALAPSTNLPPPFPRPPSIITRSYLESLTTIQLRDMCQPWGLKVAGTKADLVLRLMCFIANESGCSGNRKQLEAFVMGDLKSICADKGLPTSGTKEDFIVRLMRPFKKKQERGNAECDDDDMQELPSPTVHRAAAAAGTATATTELYNALNRSIPLPNTTFVQKVGSQQ